MHQTYTNSEKMRVFFQIFLPILIYQVANFSASFIDTMMTGQYGTLDLAGVAMATSIWHPMFTLVTGILSAIVPIIGYHLGKGHQEKVARDVWQFIYLSFCLAIILFLIIGFGAPLLLENLGLQAEVLVVGKNYLYFMLLGILPLLLFSVCRSFFDALGLTKLSMYLMLLLLPFNTFFNYLLIYGIGPIPEFGGAGAGLGTSMAYWALLLVILGVMFWHPKIRTYRVFKPQGLHVPGFMEGWKLGLPIGGAVFAESAIFAAVGFFMARFSSEVTASHQAAMNFSNMMYAFPLSVSMTMAIIISYEKGAKRLDDVLAYSRIGRLMAILFATVTLLFLYIFRDQVAALYGKEPEFIRLTSQFLVYALFFQFADALLSPIQGILRGYKDTTYPFVIGIISYWIIALPLGYFLDIWTSFGPDSYWIGLNIGLWVCAFLLQWRMMSVQKNEK
ncbi:MULTISPECIES: MATE family efflux transporter [unclassified Streptococcus]|uniref:MATE family efflux transporter n=1 Tax=unclassified Streptococcus TaxID=2608887 RepID=UPI00107167DC|nr:MULTISPECIES: MATE family efflux transporter [unclassified Streptococcus]MBF0805298.1 MATE family efflux transporter [Streptococcus sp. 19428wA2_WM07]TFU29332.1 MATE family efflux transporter [Streptococcus sp. WM07]